MEDYASTTRKFVEGVAVWAVLPVVLWATVVVVALFVAGVL